MQLYLGLHFMEDSTFPYCLVPLSLGILLLATKDLVTEQMSKDLRITHIHNSKWENNLLIYTREKGSALLVS